MPLSLLSHFISQSEHYWNYKAIFIAVLIKLLQCYLYMASRHHQGKFLVSGIILTNIWSPSGFRSKWPIKLRNLPLVSNFGRLRLWKFAQEWIVNLIIYHQCHTWLFLWFDQLALSCQKVSKRLSKFNQKLSQMATVWCKTLLLLLLTWVTELSYNQFSFFQINFADKLYLAPLTTVS